MNPLLKILWLLGLSLWINNLLYAQETLKKEKIYTLSAEEQLAYNENSLGVYQDELGYIVVTAKLTSNRTSRTYHIQGKSYGPYDRPVVDKPVFSRWGWGFIDSKGEVSDIVVNGERIGRHKEPQYPLELKMSQGAWAYLLYDMLTGNSIVKYNGKEYGPYKSLKNCYLNHKGDICAIAYSNKPGEYKLFFTHDRSEVGPFLQILDFKFLEGDGNRWVMTVKKTNDAFTVVTNQGEVGSFSLLMPGYTKEAANILAEGVNYGMPVRHEGQIYFLANDELYGPYADYPKQVSFGKAFNRFNYLLGEQSDFYFKGEKGFSTNVEKYFLSESRQTVAIIKQGQGKQDSLIINDKDLIGLFENVEYVKFAPKSEDWVLLSNRGGGSYALHFSDGRSLGPFNLGAVKQAPDVLVGKGCKNWAISYTDNSGNNRLIINNEEWSNSFLGNVVIIAEGGQEYFSWFSIEDRTIYLNKLIL